jgi:glycosyltransferase involved in cell wall biosynthesis
MSRSGLVSVILPTYNRAGVLPRAVRSVLSQTYKSWELIIVDDESIDQTAEATALLAREDPRIIYIYQQHSGPAAGRNNGTAAAQGEYLSFLDSDDEYLPEHLERRVRYLREHPEADFLHGGAHILGGIDKQYVPDKDNPSILVHLSDCVIGGTFFCRRGIIDAAGGWRSNYAEDADLFERVSAQFAVRQVDFETYLYHRDSPDSRCDEAEEAP